MPVLLVMINIFTGCRDNETSAVPAAQSQHAECRMRTIFTNEVDEQVVIQYKVLDNLFQSKM